MSDPNKPVSPTSLPPLSDVYFRRFFVPIVISIITLVFAYVITVVPTSLYENQTIIGGGRSLMKKLLFNK